MNAKTQTLLAAGVVALIAATAVADFKSGLGTGTYTLVDDSSNTTAFVIGSSAAGADANEFDTSDVYDAKAWNHLVLGVKSSPRVSGWTEHATFMGDSGAVTVFTQGSNDRTYWKDIDTTTAVDSLPVSEELWYKERTYRYLRWVIKPGTKLNDSGMTVNLKLNAVQR